MNVLVACEESQIVCKAFRAKGHRAFSCDLQACSGGRPEWHIQGDALELLKGDCTFQTSDTHTHTSGQVGFHNRASALHLSIERGSVPSVSSQRRTGQGPIHTRPQGQRVFYGLLVVWIPRVRSDSYRESSSLERVQSAEAQPFDFGEDYSKKTYLWEFGVPSLMPTEIVWNSKPFVSCGTSKNKGNREKAGASRAGGTQKARSKTFPKIAEAMAEQWSR